MRSIDYLAIHTLLLLAIFIFIEVLDKEDKSSLSEKVFNVIGN